MGFEVLIYFVLGEELLDLNISHRRFPDIGQLNSLSSFKNTIGSYSKKGD
jgi:hypothetical protein